MPSQTTTQRAGPDLKRYMNKQLRVKLNGSRVVSGKLCGFDQFMNLTLEDAVEHVSATEENRIGSIVVRGSCIVQMESLDPVRA